MALKYWILFSVVLSITILLPTHAAGDTVLYSSAPNANRYSEVTQGLSLEFGTTSLPPIVETGRPYYRVSGTGPVDLKFRFHTDTGGFNFSFGCYFVRESLEAIDTSTDMGRIEYATAALAPRNSFVVFDDVVDDPGATATVTIEGGSRLGFFLIPNEPLNSFQTTPGNFAIDGVGAYAEPPPNRWPLFGLAEANPGGLDQLLSFAATSVETGSHSHLFAWEDLTRAEIADNPIESDGRFNDLVFGIEGVASVPEPAALALAASVLAALPRRTRR